jgi:HrpA-like RNA helicase
MSATLDEQLFYDYYNDACLMKIPGRTFPIEDEYATEDPENYVDATITKTVEIHASKQPGDILAFLTGPDEINRAIEEMNVKILPYGLALVLPLHGKLNEDETQAIFKPTANKERKIIFATNVAETSITIDGICHVIDSGMVKEVMWDSKRNMRALKIGYTTQSSVKQRRGRAGRTAAGKVRNFS